MQECPFAPSPADPIEDGLSLINSMLDFEEEGTREPTLLISAKCKAIIFSLKVWTGKDEKKGCL